MVCLDRGRWRCMAYPDTATDRSDTRKLSRVRARKNYPPTVQSERALPGPTLPVPKKNRYQVSTQRLDNRTVCGKARGRFIKSIYPNRAARLTGHVTWTQRGRRDGAPARGTSRGQGSDQKNCHDRDTGRRQRVDSGQWILGPDRGKLSRLAACPRRTNGPGIRIVRRPRLSRTGKIHGNRRRGRTVDPDSGADQHKPRSTGGI